MQRACLLGMVALTLAAGAAHAQQNRFEPNQTRRTASRIEPGDYKRLLCDEEDWYVLTVPAGHRLEVSLQFSHAQGDLELELRDGRGRALGWSRGQRDEESLTFAPGAETAVFLHVYNARNMYDLHVGLTPSPWVGPGVVGAPSLEGVVCQGLDWYLVPVEAAKQLRVELTFSHAAGDLDLALFDPEGTEVQSSTERGDREQLRWTAGEEARRMLLLVSHVQRGSHRYALRVEQGASALEDLDRVLGLERPLGRGNDLIELRNGDRLPGEVLDEAFPLVTPYAELVLPRERLAGLDLERARSEVETALTVEGWRLSGILRQPTLRFRMADQSQPLEIPRERVLRVVFGRRGEERSRSRSDQYVVLRSGDHFAARLVGAERWGLDLGFASIPLDPARLQSIRFEPDGRVTVTRLDQGSLQGRLAVEQLRLGLEGLGAQGERVDLHVERVDTLFLQPGFTPERVGGDSPPGYDFEAGLEPWVAQGTPLTSWVHWTQDAVQGKACARACGPNGANYCDGARATLTSPAITIRGMAAPVLTFQVRARLERGADFLVVRASYDGGVTYAELHRVSGDVEWTPLSLPLQPGGEEVLIQFSLESDGSITSLGVWVDQVEVVDQVPPGGR